MDLDSRPFVTLKSAMTLDGAIATRDGESKWITGPRARGLGRRLRQRHDAIIVGSGTALADDPELTARAQDGTILEPTPARFVLDTHARLPLSARLLSPETAPITIVVGPNAPSDRVTALRRHASIWVGPLDGSGRIDLAWVMGQMRVKGLRSLLVEGGAELVTQFVVLQLADHIVFFYAPMTLGQSNARRCTVDPGFETSERCPQLRRVRVHQLGEDLLLSARLKRRQ